jgi:lipopolysaccharide biosynthesis regulator YciM
LSKHSSRLIPISIVIGLILVGVITLRRPLISAWYTDLGAVKMAKIELSDFPSGTWDSGQNVDLLFPAEALFRRALVYESSNPGANFRLGLIAMLKHDFSEAVNHLEIPYHGDPYHRGVIKVLGLAYVWKGQIEEASGLLTSIPEANQELGIYTWWWREQGRPDLAAFAEQYLALEESVQK